MTEITGGSGTTHRRAALLSWLRRVLGALEFSRQREARVRRIDEQAWSHYMLRDVGLDEARRSRGHDPRDLPFGWPLR